MCELVDGVLVEKALGFRESYFTAVLLRFLVDFVYQNNLGIVLTPDTTMKLFPDLIRAPDVSFFSWDRLPGGKVPEEPVPAVAPDLAVEILSKSNTRKEMDRKVGEYFASGVRLVWLIDPKKKTVQVYTDPQTKRTLHEQDTLDGGDVLPRLSLNLAEFFTPPNAPRRR